MTGQLRLWLPIALDKSMWNYHHIDKLKYPNREIPQPQPQSQRNGNPSTPPRANRTQSENQQPPSPPRRRGRRARSPRNGRNSNSTFDESLVGYDWDVSAIALGVHRRATQIGRSSQVSGDFASSFILTSTLPTLECHQEEVYSINQPRKCPWTEGYSVITAPQTRRSR